MKSFELVVLVVLIGIVGCLQGFINFDFKEFKMFFPYASPLVYGHWLYERRQKSDQSNQGRGT